MHFIYNNNAKDTVQSGIEHAKQRDIGVEIYDRQQKQIIRE